MRDDQNLAGISSADLSRVIGLIYDCAIDPACWPKALEAMCQLFGSEHGAISLLDPTRREIRFGSFWSTDSEWPNWQKLLDKKYATEMPLFEALPRLDVCEVVNTEILVRYLNRQGFDFYQSKFFKEWAEPAGLRDCVASVVVRAPNRFCMFTMHTGLDDDLVNPRQLAICERFVPHVRRAVLIGDLLDMRALESQSLKAALDLIGAGVILTDSDAQVVHANAAARSMIATGDPITSEAGRLGARGERASSALRSAVACAAREEASLGQTGIGLPVPFADGRPAVAHVLPLTKPPIRNGLSPSASAAVFVGTADVDQAPAEAMGALYELTPAEQRVLISVLAGRNQTETALHLGVSDNTVKTHLSRIFSKTRTTSQAEMQRLAERLAARVSSRA